MICLRKSSEYLCIICHPFFQVSELNQIVIESNEIKNGKPEHIGSSEGLSKSGVTEVRNVVELVSEKF